MLVRGKYSGNLRFIHVNYVNLPLVLCCCYCCGERRYTETYEHRFCFHYAGFLALAQIIDTCRISAHRIQEFASPAEYLLELCEKKKKTGNKRILVVEAPGLNNGICIMVVEAHF